MKSLAAISSIWLILSFIWVMALALQKTGDFLQVQSATSSYSTSR